MVLSKDGNLGIGATSPSYPLHVYGSGAQNIAIESTSAQADIYCMGSVSTYTRSGGFRLYNSYNNIGFIGCYTDSTTSTGKLAFETRGSGDGSPVLRAQFSANGDFWHNPLGNDTNFIVSTDARTYGFFVDGGNNCVGIGTNAFGSSASGTLAIINGTEPTSAQAGQIEIYSKDSSDGSANATLGLRLEQAVETIGTFTASHKLKLWINGTEYWVQLDAV